jgi:hypothetical protein
MLGTQKELGALTEGGELQPWPELFEQIAMLQQYLAEIATELKILERQRLGQQVIDVYYPRQNYPRSFSPEDFQPVAAACRNAVFSTVEITYATDGEATVLLRCVLDPKVDRQTLLDAGIDTPKVAIRFDQCRQILLRRQPEYSHWGGERISSWEIDAPTGDEQYRFSLVQRIRGTYGTAIELETWGMTVTEVLD